MVSQPKPERSPYYELEKKYGLQIDWRPFIHVEEVSAKEFRKQKVIGLNLNRCIALLGNLILNNL